ncbi:MAG TPA: hypothetical protein VNE39_01200 [Planctomycetota bacterium]|nr:hypothetical protein [Planctomycetota bacterium]
MSPTPREHYTTERVEVPLPRETRRELWLLAGLFVTARLMSIWWFEPRHSDVALFFTPFAWLQGQGVYPFLDYWYEYLPVQAYLIVALRWVALAVCGRGSPLWESTCLVRTVQVASVVWELAILHLVYTLARMLRGPKPAVRACWVYVALFSTGFVSLSYVEAFPVFLMLVSVFLAAYSSPVWGAVVVAGGFMAKLLPIGVLPALLKCDARWRWRLVAIGALALTVAGLSAPFLLGGRPWLALSFECTAKRPPWGTVWALLDGRREFGYVGPGPQDQTPAFFQEESGFGVGPRAEELLKSAPPEIFGSGPPVARRTHFYHVAAHFATKLKFLDSAPRTGETYWWVYGGVGVALALFYLVTFARLPSALPPRRRLYLAAFTMFLLFFYTKGWSPQFVLYLIPLVLITFPVAEGGLWALLLTVVVFLEMPVWTMFVHGRPGMVVADSLLLHATVIARTALFLVIAARLYPRLFND